MVRAHGSNGGRDETVRSDLDGHGVSADTVHCQLVIVSWPAAGRAESYRSMAEACAAYDHFCERKDTWPEPVFRLTIDLEVDGEPFPITRIINCHKNHPGLRLTSWGERLPDGGAVIVLHPAICGLGPDGITARIEAQRKEPPVIHRQLAYRTSRWTRQEYLPALLYTPDAERQQPLYAYLPPTAYDNADAAFQYHGMTLEPVAEDTPLSQPDDFGWIWIGGPPLELSVRVDVRVIMGPRQDRLEEANRLVELLGGPWDQPVCMSDMPGYVDAISKVGRELDQEYGQWLGRDITNWHEKTTPVAHANLGHRDGSRRWASGLSLLDAQGGSTPWVDGPWDRFDESYFIGSDDKVDVHRRGVVQLEFRPQLPYYESTARNRQRNTRSVALPAGTTICECNHGSNCDHSARRYRQYGMIYSPTLDTPLAYWDRLGGWLPHDIALASPVRNLVPPTSSAP